MLRRDGRRPRLMLPDCAGHDVGRLSARARGPVEEALEEGEKIVKIDTSTTYFLVHFLNCKSLSSHSNTCSLRKDMSTVKESLVPESPPAAAAAEPGEVSAGDPGEEAAGEDGAEGERPSPSEEDPPAAAAKPERALPRVEEVGASLLELAPSAPIRGTRLRLVYK